MHTENVPASRRASPKRYSAVIFVAAASTPPSAFPFGEGVAVRRRMRSFPVQKLFGSIFCVYATPMAADCRRYGLGAGCWLGTGGFSYTRGLWRQVAAATDWARDCWLGTRFFSYTRVFGGLEAAATAVEAAFISVAAASAPPKPFPASRQIIQIRNDRVILSAPVVQGGFALFAAGFFVEGAGLRVVL